MALFRVLTLLSTTASLLREFIKEQRFADTIFPRIPVPIQKEMLQKLKEHDIEVAQENAAQGYGEYEEEDTATTTAKGYDNRDDRDNRDIRDNRDDRDRRGDRDRGRERQRSRSPERRGPPRGAYFDRDAPQRSRSRSRSRSRERRDRGGYRDRDYRDKGREYRDRDRDYRDRDRDRGIDNNRDRANRDKDRDDRKRSRSTSRDKSR